MWPEWSLRPSCKLYWILKKGSARRCSLFFKMKFPMRNLSLALLLIIGLVACRTETITDQTDLSPATRQLINRVLNPYVGDTLVDNHVHIVGLGNSNSGIEVQADLQTIMYPFKFTRFAYFLDAARVTDKTLADEQYVAELKTLIDQFPQPFQVVGLALDRNYSLSGEINQEQTEIYVPNTYIYALSQSYPEMIIPAISVHPYRRDAVAELEKWAAQGVRIVKWIPNAMGINPALPICDPFYAAMVRLDMVLLSHAGDEHAIDSAGRQFLGNPLLLRRALDAGVKVVVAHCAVAGSSVDLDDPQGGRVANFELFMRLFQDPQYQGLLFGDISAMTLLNQVGYPLQVLLSHPELQTRLFYGSDYPLPAVKALNNTRILNMLGYLPDELVVPLNEIRAYDPLLYNFVLLRSLQNPASGQHFSVELFRRRIDRL